MEPEYEPTIMVTNDCSRMGDAGALWLSYISFVSQKTWYTSSPELYASLGDSAHAKVRTSVIQFRSDGDRLVGFPSALRLLHADVGVHRQS